MASLLFDQAAKTFYVRFRYGGRSFKRSLETANQKLARGQVTRVEEMLLLLRRGRLTIPPAADPAVFILSDGKLLQHSESKLVTLAELMSAFQANRVAGHKEASTIKTENIHIRHLSRILKGNTFAQAIGYTQVQSYVAKRLGELVGGKRPVSTETVRKEVATFRVIWNWALKRGLVDGPPPVSGLEYPKRDEKPPFMTWEKLVAAKLFASELLNGQRDLGSAPEETGARLGASAKRSE
jgi:hypothetical protein